MTFSDGNALIEELVSYVVHCKQRDTHCTCASHPVWNCLKFANYCHPHLVNQILKIFYFTMTINLL